VIKFFFCHENKPRTLIAEATPADVKQRDETGSRPAVPQYSNEAMMSASTPPYESPDETIDEPIGMNPAISATIPRPTMMTNA
jgi:hypothetical protein